MDELDAVRKCAPEYERPWMDKLKSIAANSISKFLDEDDLVSGIVIACFGEKDRFPSVITYELKGIIDGKSIAIERSHIKMSKSNTAAIKPFAQSEEVWAFLFGHNRLVDIVQDSMKDIFEKVDPDKLGDLLEREKTYGDEQIGQIQNRIRLFDKNELAEVAEAFIKLTILRKKITPVFEDVGGPVDVAVISKGDGFVWVKRKRYVDPSLNPQFSEILTK